MLRGVILAAALGASPALAQVGAQGAAQDHPLSVWTKPAADGSVEHLQSGLKCPETIGSFKRTSYKNLNPFGLDILCGWNGEKAIVTAYMTRGPSLQQMFDGAKTSIEKNDVFQGVRKKDDGPVEAWGLKWLRATYVTGIGAQTEVWVTDFAGWTLKYRVTYPDRDTGLVNDAMRAMSDTAITSAGPRAKACGGLAPVERKGKLQPRRGKEVDPIAMASILGVAAASLPPSEEKAASVAPKPAPVTFCVERALTSQKAPLLLWRAVGANGTDGNADRIGVMTTGEPINLDVGLDDLATKIEDELGGRAKTPRWTAAISNAKGTNIYGYFTGRPAPDAAAAFLQQILDGKAQPITGISADGKNITVNIPK